MFPSPARQWPVLNVPLSFFARRAYKGQPEVAAMRRLGWLAVVAWAAGGCAPTVPELVHDYNEDGVFLFRQGRYEYATETFKAALALQPDNPDLVYNLAQCQDRRGQLAQAEQLYGQCLQRSPDHAECHHALAVLLVQQGRRDEAVRMVEEWLQRSPKLAAAYAEDGWLYAQANDPRRALMRYQQALDFDPHDNRALVEMGRLYEEMHYPDRALVLYQHALQVNPQQPEVSRRVAELRNAGTGPPRPDE
jgi:tetratricopeptide (TPR) repeat protein